MTTASQTQPAAVKNNQRLANASEKILPGNVPQTLHQEKL
jgi:hypothetical protein